MAIDGEDRGKKGFGSEYVFGDVSERTDRQTNQARWILIDAIQRLVPEFLQALQTEVYPEFLRLAKGNRDYFCLGTPFEFWKKRSDSNGEMTGHLKTWAQHFEADETWVLEGALGAMTLWTMSDESRRSLDSNGFRQVTVGDRTIAYRDEAQFCFKDRWDPQSTRWEKFREESTKRFKKELGSYKEGMRELAKDLRLEKSRVKYSPEHFDWLALYKCGGLSLKDICERYSRDHENAKTTVHRGISTAAELAATSFHRR